MVGFASQGLGGPGSWWCSRVADTPFTLIGSLFCAHALPPLGEPASAYQTLQIRRLVCAYEGGARGVQFILLQAGQIKLQVFRSSSQEAEMSVRAFRRAKRVTDPLDDKVKARIRGDDGQRPLAGCTSGGSENEAVELSGLVHGFFFSSSDGEQGDPEGDEATDGDEDDTSSEGQYCFYGALPSAGMIRDLVSPPAVAFPAEDRFWRDLQVGAATAAARFAGLRASPATFRRAVMGSLREIGYNAGICKTKWETGGGGLVAGTYEYIDVMAASPPRRYIVDVEFASEFEIARPTAEYGRLVEELPRVFVGRPEALRRLLGLLAEAARRSLRAREMHVPPWRRSRYMRAKWLGPYRRTVDPSQPPSPPSSPPFAPAPESPSAAPSAPGRGDVKCRLRAVGFDTAAASPVIQTSARTR
ncbi:hypothetical protein Taro_055390 [Colocasia esculenta]|uniref:Uncharacterized protein n=1 Tax=Colocasia esculenta TaxID=4460 RepID=A0A843XR97_COLES|nr:hypothetical protein [Colocasia esculenta]